MTLNMLLGVILTVMGLIGVLIIVIFCTPIVLRADFDTADKRALDVKLFLIGGLVPIPMKDSSKQQKPSAKKRSRKKQRKKATKFFKTSDIKSMLRAAPRLISRLLTKIKLSDSNVGIVYGFEDPADTGMIYGLLSPLNIWSHASPNAPVRLQADFDRAVFSGRGGGTAKFIPASLIPPTIAFGWTAFVQPRLSWRD